MMMSNRTPKTKNKDLLLALLKESVEECYKRDRLLIDISMEQASVARIYYYMQRALEQDKRFSVLSTFNLDCEYNKNKEERKDTQRCKKGTRPDIILHERGIHDENLLVVEFKARKARVRKSQYSDKSMDFVKLEDFTKKDDIYDYYLGVYVKLNKRGAKYIFFQDGNKKSEEELRDG